VTDLIDRVAELVAIPSPSHGETAIADHIAARLAATPWLEVARVGDNVVARSADGGAGRLILAGHLDTVPANGNETPRRRADVLWGLGTADMKGGLAVMLELAGAPAPPPVGVTFVFYVAEEVARRHNGLLTLAAERPDLLAGDAAILGEPTGAVVEAGCQGVLKLDVTLGGARAHTARPWMGVNAVHRLGPVLDLVAAWPGRRPVIDGCEYREALQAVGVAGGVAGNVVPDLARLSLSHRFAPDRSAADAETAVRALLAPALLGATDHVEVTDAAPGAAPGLDHPQLARLVYETGAPPRAKLGWTDVAFFAERGIPAVNFGPGDPELAHTAGERVTGSELDAALGALQRVVFGAG
jgi:succinyl-diaminopimelate desuccinylase